MVRGGESFLKDREGGGLQSALRGRGDGINGNYSLEVSDKPSVHRDYQRGLVGENETHLNGHLFSLSVCSRMCSTILFASKGARTLM